MVVALGPGKFYGSSLPRPRIYTDVKLSDERVDPPISVLDPLLSWANEAHWSMGGLNVKRHRLQGRIEGSIKKLRAEREKLVKKKKHNNDLILKDSVMGRADNIDIGDSSKSSMSLSPPPAPIVTKRRRFVALVDEDDEDDDDDEGGVGVRVRRRKLWDDFDRVASESEFKGNVKAKRTNDELRRSSDGSDTVASRTRSRRSEEGDGVVEEVKGLITSKGKKLKRRGSPSHNGIRTSPRLLKRGAH